MSVRRYRVTCGDRIVDVEVRDAGAVCQLVVGGRRFSAELSPADVSGLRRLRAGKLTVSTYVALNGNRCSVALRGIALDLLVENERSARLASFSGAAARSAGPAQVVAPMPGLVVRVDVRAGQPIRQGEILVALQAMKMENELVSPRDATIRAVHIQPGQTVELGQLLVELE